MKYAIMVQFGLDEGWIYVCDPPWSETMDPVLYNTKEEAKKASTIWNNPKIVEYNKHDNS